MNVPQRFINICRFVFAWPAPLTAYIGPGWCGCLTRLLQGVHRQITGQIRISVRHKISLFCVLHQMAALMVLVMFTIRRGLSCECGAWNGITRLNMYKKKAPRLFYCFVIVASRITKTLRQQRVVVFGAGRCGQHKTDAVNVHRWNRQLMPLTAHNPLV